MFTENIASGSACLESSEIFSFWQIGLGICDCAMYRTKASLPGRGRFDSQTENVFLRDVLRSTHLLTITKEDRAAGSEEKENETWI